MSTVIEDFSTKVEMVNPDNGYRYTDFVDLRIMEWKEVFGETKVASTFNSESENTARILFKALLKYGELVFVTGVTGRTKNVLIQREMTNHMDKLFGDKVGWVPAKYSSTKFFIRNA